MVERAVAGRATMLWIGAGTTLVVVAIVVLASLLGVVGPRAERERAETASAAGGQPPGLHRLGVMDAGVAESSGAAVSRRHPGILWTHDDQSGKPVLYALTLDGALTGRFTVRNARARDWEALALGACPGRRRGSDCLYVADIGDNEARRGSYAVYAVPEPDPWRGGGVEAVALASFRYPEGPADAEALALAPGGGLLVVTKGGDGGARLYRVPASAFAPATGGPTAGESAAGAVAAERLATLPIDVRAASERVSGAAMSPDGRTLAVRTASSVYLFAASDPSRPPTACPLGDRQPRGEAVDFLDDGTLVLTSEGARTPILRLRCSREGPDAAAGAAAAYAE